MSGYVLQLDCEDLSRAVVDKTLDSFIYIMISKIKYTGKGIFITFNFTNLNIEKCVTL